MRDNEELDVVVFGATGYTGRLVCDYLNRQYAVGRDVNWALGEALIERLERHAGLRFQLED